ncbi:MAG: hypothetical protein EA350_12405 [Gemmatimonadales bacterium]|nr:MAG: hypothetical protein EA350_12405 [Gemmatimonadales bacterium]
MHEAMRRRILRRLETLPETQLYQVLDYIEFLESRYNRGIPEETTALQKLAEKLEDGLRKGKVNPSNLREAFQLISTADRVLSSVSAAGKQLLDELQAPEEGGPPTRSAQRSPGDPRPRASGVPAPRPSPPADPAPPIRKPPPAGDEG